MMALKPSGGRSWKKGQGKQPLEKDGKNFTSKMMTIGKKSQKNTQNLTESIYKNLMI